MTDRGTSTRWAPFAYGFRPFFLLAGLYAVAAVTAWLFLFDAADAWPVWPLPFLWHGHEMLFGFVAAAIAGFMLTAVPSWTGSRGFAGAPLVLLALLWVAGRLALGAGDLLPFPLLAAAELLFLPGLVLVIAPSLLRAVSRNTPLLLVLAALWAADFYFLRSADAGNVAAASSALRIALDIVLLLITVIGGRITPAFTSNALKRRGIEASFRSSPLVERLVIAAMLAYLALDLAGATPLLVVIVSGAAALLHLVRLSRWHTPRTLGEPIVWVLHLGYAMLPFGLLLRALHAGGGFAWAAYWQHALGAGAAAMMILAVMTRASLGHTGRPLIVSPAIVVSYVALAVAVLLRVLGPALLPVDYRTTILVAGGAWLVAFGLFVAVYAPVLLRPRADGRAG